MAADGGRGSLLMANMGLPHDEHGHPFQVVTVLAPDGRGTVGLETDEDGHPLGLVMDRDGDVPDVFARRRVPAEVERAALTWWEDHRRASGP